MPRCFRILPTLLIALKLASTGLSGGNDESDDPELEELLMDPELRAVAEAIGLTETGASKFRWMPTFTLELGGGFKDNVALSSTRPASSGALRVMAEAMLLLPPENGWESYAYGSWEDLEYAEGTVDREQFGMLVSEIRKTTTRGWRFTANARLLHLNQVVDLSTDFATPVILVIAGENYGGQLALRKELPHQLHAELTTELARQDFAATLDDYWEIGPRCEVGKVWGAHALALSYQFADRVHDRRAERDRSGAVIPGTQLEFNNHMIELDWRREWGDAASWKLTSRIRRELRFDNGGGFFRYRRWQIVEQLRWEADRWSVAANAAWSTYFYPNQPATAGVVDRRWRNSWNLDLRIARRLSRRWSVYAQGEHERSRSNQPGTTYRAWIAHAGVAFAY